MLSETNTGFGGSQDQFGYQPQVSELIRLGERALRGPAPRDYRAMGITAEHLAELERMARDPIFDRHGPEVTAEFFAPMHAMRALCQIATESTIEPLIRLLEYDDTTDYDDMNDWFLEEIPDALAAFGGAAIPPLARLLANESKHVHSRWTAARALEKIASHHPDGRAECVRLITSQLDRFEENDPELNGGLVGALIDMQATESASSIERAFAADRVDETIAGDWEEVQAELGLRPPLTPEELREKASKREAAHGWVSPSDMFDEDFEDLDDWDDSEDSVWNEYTPEESNSDPSFEARDRPRMFMPEDIYTADERRQLARQRNKERKATQKSKARQKQNKGRR